MVLYTIIDTTIIVVVIGAEICASRFAAQYAPNGSGTVPIWPNFACPCLVLVWHILARAICPRSCDDGYEITEQYDRSGYPVWTLTLALTAKPLFQDLS